MNRDLTQGKPWSVILWYALPLVGGSFFQQLYSVVDSILVGQIEGTQALAAVGCSTPITFLGLAIAQGLAMGTNVAVSQLFGARRLYQMKTTITTALLAMGVVGLFFSVLGPLLSGPMLRGLQTDPVIFDNALAYLQIYFFGSGFLFFFNTLNGIFTAMGDSKTPLLFLICSTFINIGLDLLFLVQFHMGVAGVAWATMIAQGLCSLASFAVLFKRFQKMDHQDLYHTGLEHPPLFRWTAVRHIARIGLPSTLQQSVASLSFLSMQGLVNSYGHVFVGGYTAATKVDSFAVLPGLNFNNAMSSFTAQNLGAGKPERVREGYRSCLVMGVCVSVMITLLIYAVTPQLLALFLEDAQNNPSLDYGLLYLRTVSLFYPLMSAFFITVGVLRGGGAMKSFICGSGFNLVSRAVFAYTFRPYLGQSSIWWSLPAGWLVGFVVIQFCYHRGFWNHQTSFEEI